jgi:hypothetical protein
MNGMRSEAVSRCRGRPVTAGDHEAVPGVHGKGAEAMKRWGAVVTVLLLAGMIGVAEAGKGKQQGDGRAKGKGGSVSLATLDANGDGEVSKEEWDAAFAKLDQNGDGKLTSDDLQKNRGKKGRGKRNR